MNRRIKTKVSQLAVLAIGGYVNTVALFSPRQAGKIALDLFSKPRARKHKLHDADLLSEARQEGMEVNGHTVHFFHWVGEGPRVMLAHGWESNASRWEVLVRSLQKNGYDIVAPDAPSHGLSGGETFNVVLYADALRELMISLRPQTLIGHSAGGMAAVFLLYNHPELAPKNLVLLAVPSELNLLMDRFRRMVGMNDKVFNGMQEVFHLQYGWKMSDFAIHRFIQKLKIPGLVVHDEADPIAPMEEGLSIHENWKGSRFTATRGLGHSLHGEEVVRAIIDYLEDHKPT
ncbi:MAG: alpha/beta hydrolase [Haliscomenobacter sp.]|nr:alpha/beta hydrolase [Haliscomenobacter sp.]